MEFPFFTEVMGDVFFKIVKNLWREHIHSKYGQEEILLHSTDVKMLPRVFDGGFLIEFCYRKERIVLPNAAHAAEVMKLVYRTRFQPNNTVPDLLMNIQKLPRT